MFSFIRIPVIFSKRILGFYMKMHWVLKGPEWTFNDLVLVSLFLSLAEVNPPSREEFKFYFGDVSGSLWNDRSMLEFYCVFVRLLRAEGGVVPIDYLFFVREESLELLATLLLFFLSSCIYWSILIEICRSWSESYCLFLLSIYSPFVEF